MTAATSPEEAAERAVRSEYARILATLIRVTGDVDLAQDAVQDAVLRALQTWPRDGVPDEPRAWLTVVARRCAIDRIRRDASRQGKEADAVWLLDNALPEPVESVVRDDLLRLVFTCCHPTLSRDAQIALSLRTLGGLSTADVARALLVPEATMAKRLTRAKQKIRQARIPYRVPADDELPARLDGVLSTVYLMFNEGYAAGAGETAMRGPLIDEAVRLGRLLHDLMPDEASVTGLLALMLLQDSRRSARVAADGTVVPLAEQDRGLWDPEAVREGVELVGAALRRTPDRPDPYVVQAAIAACHALAADYEATDWDAVLSWYDVLLTVERTPVARLGRAAAVAERDGPEAGLRAVDAVDGLAGYAWWHASRAELLGRLGRVDEAVAASARAVSLGLNDAHARFVTRRRPDSD
ncbi:MAG: sigma-70 family RNA polymerase sigma factor [Actinomycetota bacterium]|nr:sigma-70 family RNA polymerase sigma factor [Actinomycetota bacterium]